MAYNVDIRGLSDKGFRIKNSGGAWVNLKRGMMATVDVDLAATANTLRRYNDDWVRATNPVITIRGLRRGQQSGSVAGLGSFRGSQGKQLVIGTLGTNAVRVVNKNPGASPRIAFVNPGGTAARSITVSGSDITVSLAVTTGAINATETAPNIATAINGNTAAAALVAAQNDGTGVVTTIAMTALTEGSPTNVKSGTNVLVNVDDPHQARRLRRNRATFVVATGATVSIKGLSDRGFRIKNNGGAIVTLKRGAAAQTINLADGAARRVLMEHFDEWIEA